MRCGKAAQPHTQKKKVRETDGEEAKSIELCYLSKGPGSALDAKLCVAELAVAGVGGWEPLLQAALVHCAQGARAVARRQQALAATAFMANAADGTVTGKEKHLKKYESCLNRVAKCWGSLLIKDTWWKQNQDIVRVGSRSWLIRTFE